MSTETDPFNEHYHFSGSTEPRSKMASFIDDNVSIHSCPTQPKIIDGYPKLAEHMGSAPEISIFRRFESLNRQNLLYLQAELTTLERELRNIEAESASCDTADPRSLYARDWEWMNIIDEKSNMNPQWQLFLRIRTILKEYSKQLVYTPYKERG